MRHKNIIKIILTSMLSLYTCTVCYASSTVENYDLQIKTHNLGNYNFYMESHEIPSNEFLPIVGKEYFPYSTASFVTEVENTKPSALYHAKTVAKVDIVFALGDTSQSERLQAFIPTFTTMLESAGNHIDAHVEQVKTSTIDMAAFGAEEIFNTWTKMPESDGFGSKVWKLNQALGQVYCEGNKKLASGAHRSSMIVDLSDTALETTDFTLEFTHNTKGPAGEETYRNVRNGWAPHISGIMFRYTEDASGKWDSYMLCIGDTSTAYSSGTGNPYCAIIKINNGDVDMLPGRYAGTLPVGWSAGVTDTSGALSSMRIDHQGLTYTQGVWCKGERSSASDMLLIGARAIKGTTSHDFKLEVKGNNIKVYCGGVLQLDLNDTYSDGPNSSGQSPYMKGAYGFFSYSSPNVYFSNVKITKGERKSLGDAISNSVWREDAARIVIHAADTVPDDFVDPTSEEYVYTLTKLLNTNGYLINIGTSENAAALQSMGDKMATASGESRSKYYDSRSPDIETALISIEEWIEELLKSMSKPVDWILVNEEILWETSYNDTELDVPMNYGQNQDDYKIATSWGIGLTNLYTEEKLLAERWRYRHFPTFFDNSTEVESFHDVWIEDPINIFGSPGKYRINYKRRDNPFYSQDVSNTSLFDVYRYFSTDYDKITALS